MSSSRVPEIQLWEPDSKTDRTSQQDRESDNLGTQKGSHGLIVGLGARPYIIDLGNPEFSSSPKDVDAGTVAETTSKDMQEPIFKLAWDCDDLLTKCLEEAREEELTIEPILEQYQRSFDAWWKYLGVFAEKSSNLDRKLRKKPAVHDLVVRLLVILKDSLAQLLEVSLAPTRGTGKTDPFTPNKHVLDSIEETLEDLNRVAFAIRKSGKVTETARARAFTSERPELDAYEVLCSISLELLFQNAPESLLLQLGQSMVNRYARHLFRAPRQRVLDQDLRQPVRSDTRRKDLIPVAEALLPTSSDAPIHSRTETKLTLANAPISSIDSVKFQNYRSQQNNLKVYKSSNSRSGTTIILGNIREPPIPCFEGKQQTQCEWCFRPLGREVIENGKWSAIGRDHYRKDLEPYPCVWQNCPKGSPDFSSMRDWAAHMLQHHQNWTKHVHSQALWKCSLEMLSPEAHQKGHPADCATCTFPYTHESATYFMSVDHFLGHVRTVHKRYTGNWTENDFTTLSEESMVQMVLGSDMCPICYLIPTELETSGPKSLQNHVVGHLQNVMLLSLRLLQYPQGHPEDKEDGKSTIIAEDDSSWTGEDPKETMDDNESLSPFLSPSLIPQDTATSRGDEKETSEAWETLAGDVLQDKRIKLEREFDPVLNHIKLALEMKPPKPFTVPFQRNLKFVGRHAELRALEDNFRTGKPLVQTIVGLGGMGKTELALEFAFRIRNTYPDCSVFWLRATSAKSLRNSLQRATRRLNLVGSEYEYARHLDLLLTYFYVEHSGRWLVIIDGLDDENVLDYGDVLFPLDYGHVILTTRSNYIAADIAKKAMQLRTMDEREASLLLESRLTVKDQREEIENLVDSLDNIPLAIVQAAAYMNANRITPKDYLSLFLEGEEELFLDGKSMLQTWRVSFELIRQANIHAFHLLGFISCLDSHNELPLELLPVDGPPGSLRDAIEHLMAYSIIEWNVQDYTLSIYRLVSLGIQKWIKSLNEWDKLVADIVIRLEEVVSACDTADLNACRSLIPHVTHILGFQETNDLNERMSLLHWLGRCQTALGDHVAAEIAYRQLIEQEIRVLGNDHPEILKSLSNLGMNLLEQGRKDEARDLLMTTWRERKAILGSEHPDTLTSASQLGSANLHEDNEAALAMFEQAYRGRSSVLAPDNLETLSSAHDVGTTLRLMGRHIDAKEMLQTAYRGRMKKLGIEHEPTLESAVELANLEALQGNLRQAIGLLQQVFTARESMYGFENPNTLSSASNLAEMLMKDGLNAKAEEICRKVYEANAKTQGVNAVPTLDTLFLLGLACADQGKVGQAISLFQQLLSKTEETFGRTHLLTLAATEELIRLSTTHDDYQQAENLQQELLDVREKEYGDMHPETMDAMYRVALLAHRRHDYDKATSLYETVGGRFAQIYGTDATETIECNKNREKALRGEWPHLERA